MGTRGTARTLQAQDTRRALTLALLGLLWLICIVVGPIGHDGAVFWLTGTALIAAVCLGRAHYRIQTWITCLIASVTISLELTDALIHSIPLWIVATAGTLGAVLFAWRVTE
jgi:hypothetical protein